MTKGYSLVGPDVFMNNKGQLFKKQDDGLLLPLKNKYTEAEDRYVVRNLPKKGRK